MMDDILDYLRSDEPDQKYRGLALAGRRQLTAAVPYATHAMLSDDSARVRSIAAWALNQIASPVTVPALLDALSDEEFEVRSNAGWALVNIAHRTIPDVVVPDVVDVMRHAPQKHTRLMAYMVLEQVGGELAREAIRLYWSG